MGKVYITGLGAISPIGLSAAESFEAAVNGVLGIAKPTGFDSELTGIYAAGEVKEFSPEPLISRREAKRMARFTQFALAAANEAYTQSISSGTGGFNSDEAGVALGCGIGGLEIISEQVEALISEGPRAVSSLFIPKAIINSACGLIAIRFSFHGPCFALVTACSSGTDAIGHAYNAVAEGRAEAMLAGGSEAVVSTLAVQGFHQMGALSENTAPERASIPFDKARQGFVIAEGAAFLMLESESSVKRRGAKPLGELCGYAQTCDAFHVTAPEPLGREARRAMELAIKCANIEKEQVGYINAHGTSTPLNDVCESAAIEACFKEHAKNLKVSSTKSMTGHMLGAAGAFEAVLTLLALNEGLAPPTIGLMDEDEGCTLNYVKGKAQQLQCEYALSNSFGFGGHNSCLVLKRGEKDAFA